MPDPITTIVTVISEHPQAAAAVASIYGVAKPFLAKILGPGAEEIGEIGRDYIKGRRAKNAERTLADADKLLTEVGREPQEVPLDVAVPLLEAASLQEEQSMADLWAALLANAADPAQRVVVQPGFVDALRLLTADDTQVLNFIYTLESPGKEFSFVGHGRLIFAAIFAHFSWPKDRIELSIDNLLRQRFFSILTGGFDSVSDPDPDGIIAPTAFGKQFMLAVTPPTTEVV